LLIPLKSLHSETEKAFKPPIITTILIIINVAAFVYQYINGIGTIANTYGVIPYEITHFKDINLQSRYPVHLSLIFSLFLHGGFIHIVGNMLYLNAFGPNVENKMGHFKYLVFYFLCGIGATLCYMVPNFSSTKPLIGASGAIAGVMGAHFVSSPGSKIRCFLFPIFIISLPAIVVLIPWILIQIFNIYQSPQSNVAWIAHVGGFIIGMFLNNKFITKRRNIQIY